MKKLNWGTGIVIAFVLFISFILYFVIKTSTDTTYEYDLVAKDYYKDELEYQQRIDKLNNAKKLTQNISISKTTEGIAIHYPADISQEKIKGTVYLYRPSNKKLDVRLPITIINQTQLISKDILIGGRWNVQVEWSVAKESYLFQHSLNM
ncbi:FixH family protein [Flavicella sp.]|uniref:FixH family protein n=1 Tax=Flavicella sp. TaxID=2957742 RepID=UPI002621E748|nr:FixH family protein [Flavicella sp.]MDG1804599.1 FixH family protein [Flavicella sp.]